jgi:HD-GYP domain-containing protein (c-di-GMP phosphodiesterase class II)
MRRGWPVASAVRPPRLFIIVSVFAGVLGLITVSQSIERFGLQPSVALAMLLAAAVLSENFALSLPIFDVSLGYVLAVTAFILYGPAASGMVACVSFVNVQDIRQRKSPYAILFNFGQLTIAACVGGWVYLLAGGLPLGLEQSVPDTLSLVRTGVAVVLAAVSLATTNMVLTAYAVATLRVQPFTEVLRSMVPFIPTNAALGLMAWLVAAVLAASPWAFALFLFPLVLARETYQRYAAMKAAYLDSLRSFVGVLESKDPYTRGHSERVAQYSRRLGNAFGLDSASLERLECAALLHDLGKLIVPTRVLRKAGPLTSSETELVRRHPEAGASMVARIPPLSGIASVVRGHHERTDGAGYPDSLAGEAIPLAARILAVVDAYDAMTSSRAYRPAMSSDEAIRRLCDGAGSQFDIEVVRRFMELESHETHRLPVRGIATELASR